MALVFGPGAICGAVMLLTVQSKDLDDGLWNHLLKSKNTPALSCGNEDGVNRLAVSGEVYLSWSQVKDPLPFKEGEQFKARVTGNCYAGGGIDEPMSDKLNEWVSYRVWTCDIDKLELIDEIPRHR